MGKPREFVLSDPRKNLYAGIRNEAMEYFNSNNIPWWMGGKHNLPSGHLLSSQVACLNHLFWLRDNKDAASQILKGVSNGFVSAEIVDDGFVEFEVIGERNYLAEKSHSRGANATSLDAAMIARKKNGDKTLVMIEWKYTESYRIGESKYIMARSKIYNPRLKEPDSPIFVENPEVLYYEPYYQLMRQTLLGWMMVKAGEYGCSDFLHVHIIPKTNNQLLNRVTSPGLEGQNLSSSWKSVLVDPEKYLVITPDDFLGSLHDQNEIPIINYLRKRYWA